MQKNKIKGNFGVGCLAEFISIHTTAKIHELMLILMLLLPFIGYNAHIFCFFFYYVTDSEMRCNSSMQRLQPENNRDDADCK